MQIEITPDQAQFLINAIDLKVRTDGLASAGMGLTCATILTMASQQVEVPEAPEETKPPSNGKVPDEPSTEAGEISDGGT